MSEPNGLEAIKKAEFLDRAVARSQIKRKDAKPAIEAAMAELAEILIAGGELAFPPLGKIRMGKGRALDGGANMLTFRLRTMKLDSGQNNGDHKGENQSDDSGVAVAENDS
jgi:nucleoid DNA-binding protein